MNHNFVFDYCILWMIYSSLYIMSHKQEEEEEFCKFDCVLLR